MTIREALELDKSFEAGTFDVAVVGAGHAGCEVIYSRLCLVRRRYFYRFISMEILRKKYLLFFMPVWWNGIHSGLRNRGGSMRVQVSPQVLKGPIE